MKEKPVRETRQPVIEKTITAIYWLARQEISNEELLPLIELTKFLSVKELKYFENRISPSIRGMFFTIDQTSRELLSASVKKGNAFRILADEACDISVVEQLIDLVTVFGAILTSGQTREKLQCLYEKLRSNNFRRTAVLKKKMICKLKLDS